MNPEETPIARCPVNEVEAYEFPFFIKKGTGIEPDQLLLDIHFYHMTSEERAVIGKILEIHSEAEMADLGYPRDDLGVWVIE